MHLKVGNLDCITSQTNSSKYLAELCEVIKSINIPLDFFLLSSAEVIAGSIFRSTQTNKSNHADYLKIIKKRIGAIYKYSNST
jgi:hypothetical protein